MSSRSARVMAPIASLVSFGAFSSVVLITKTEAVAYVTEAAKLLDLERGHFYKKMKALGLRRGGGEKDGG